MGKNKKKNYPYKYIHLREGDIVKIEIRDQTYRIIYRRTFNIKDKNAILSLIKILEDYSGFSVYQLIRQKLKIGEWW